MRNRKALALSVGAALLGLSAAAAVLGIRPVDSEGFGAPADGGAEDPLRAGAPPAARDEPAIELSIDSAGVSWAPDPVPQGTIFRISLTPGSGGVRAVDGTFAGEPLHFRAVDGGGFASLAAAPIDREGTEELRLEIRYETAAELRTLEVPVVAGDYRMERLTVAPQFGRPQPPEIRRRITEESGRAMQVSRRSHDTPGMWTGPFLPPRGTRITSGFGHGRMFNDQVQSRHMGTDFGGGVGAPVLAPARGIVALVDQFYLGGNVIYLDHGEGLVTAYLHLSEQEVAEGEIVEPGQVIGRVGATGRVTGPHLHWIVRYGVITVDGMSLLQIE